MESMMLPWWQVTNREESQSKRQGRVNYDLSRNKNGGKGNGGKVNECQDLIASGG